MSVAVISKTGRRLMPTSSYRARRLLKSRRAVIYRYRPVFTIQLTDREDGKTQPIEYASDTGYKYVGVSIKSEKHEYVHNQYDLLSDEAERHNDCRKYRRARRNHLRYRKPRFDNRSKKNKDLAPSLAHRMENQINLFDQFCEVMPITQAVFEMGKFDTQLIQAEEEGRPLPEGKDYQQGSQYLFYNTREAVFTRDGFRCRICGRTVQDGVILHTHHIGYWKNYRSNRIGNLLTVCNHCHTAKNHKPGGKLWGIEPESSNLAGATYMTTVRWRMYNQLAEEHPEIDLQISYGSKTKEVRKARHIGKTHANDAYCIGSFQPLHRCREIHYVKRRRNNRILSKFYDAKYIDQRDGKKKTGSQLSCGRTNRRESRRTEKNERIWRGQKCSKGRVTIRKQHYSYQPGDLVIWNEGRYTVKGTHCKGRRVLLETGRSVKITDLRSAKKRGGWSVSFR